MFEGAYTAIITPFSQNGSVDYGKLKELIEIQIEKGIDGIVPVGTTGESPTLNHDEHKKVIEETVKVCNGRVKVIAGTGANATSEAVEFTRFASEIGADGSLQVTPYYNKPSQEGLKRHFLTIAEIGLPIVLYNIPSRSGIEISVETVVELYKHPKIAALKEAGGKVKRVSEILSECDICIVSGDDSLALPMMSVGAKGVISVAANVVPEAVADMVHFALNGQWAEAREVHQKYFRLFTALFLDTNPIPVKAALASMGKITEAYRLPLCSMSKERKEKQTNCLKTLNLLPG